MKRTTTQDVDRSVSRTATTVEVYDRTGDLRERQEPGGATTTYLYGTLGRLLKTTDPVGVVTQYSYDGNGRLVNTVAGTAGGDNSVSTTRWYDTAGHLGAELRRGCGRKQSSEWISGTHRVKRVSTMRGVILSSLRSLAGKLVPRMVSFP